MRKVHFSLIAVVLLVSLLLGAVVQAQDSVTLTVLIHQNPPMVDFINQFNSDFRIRTPTSRLICRSSTPTT